MSEISNPYIAGAPVVESSMFFGREDVFNWIERSLAGKYVNHILVLHGQRRVGKTSVLKQIPNFLPKNYTQVFFDLQGRTSTSLDRFLWWLASEIVRTLKKERDIDLPRPDRKAFEDTEYLIGEFLPSLRLILGEQILILTFDEFDTIDQPEIQESLAQPLIAYLRRLMETDGLNFVFSIGSSGDKLENMQASYTDFFKSALYRKISFLTRDDCHRLITKPVEGVIQYDRKAVERIIEITSGHPYFTQLMCHELFALCQKTGERQIRAEDVEAILGDVIERGTVNLKFVWDEATDLEKWILAGIAMLDGGTSTQKLGHLLQEQRVRFSDADLNAAIIHLRDKDVLDQENHFVIQLMRMWLQANRPLDRVREELAEVNPIANRYIEIGDEYRDRGQSSQAIESYQQAIQADPGNLKAQFNIGAVHLEGGAYTQAAAAFELALQIDDEDVGARTGYCNATLALGDAARAEHQVETAISFYEKILLFNPAHGDARLRLAEIYQQRAEASLAAGQDDAALSAFNQAMDYTPENETLAARYDEVLAQKKAKVTAEWMGRAERAQARQRWDEAAGFVEEALKLDPQNEALKTKLLEVKDAPRQEKIRGYRQEAEQAIRRGNFEKAVGALETALLLSPGDETIISWLESARSNQRNAQLLLIREQVKRAVTAGDWEAAIQFIEKAQKTAPQQEDWDKQLAGIQAARHQAQLKACRQEADRARSAGNWDDAITALQKYRQLEPSQVEIETEIEAIRLEKHQSQLLAHKTQAEKAARAEEWDEAMMAWESYLKLEPDDQAAAEKSLLQARKYATISTDYAAAQESIRNKRYGRAIELLQGIIAQEPTYKSTSRLLVEAVEANKAIPFWRRGGGWAGLAVAFLLIASIGIGIVWLGKQNFPFLIAGKVTPTTTSTSTPTRMVTLTSTATRMVTPSFTPTPAIDPAIQAVLDTIQYEKPLYQTTFDDWDTNDTGRNAALVNGKLVLTSEDETGAHFHLNTYPSDRYVVEYEISLAGDASSNEVCLYGVGNGAPQGESFRGFTTEFLPGEDLAVLARYVHQSGLDERMAATPFDKTRSNKVTLVVLGDQITAFINGELAYTAQNSAESFVYVTHAFSAFNQATCEFDYFKYWDLRDIDPIVKTALYSIQTKETFYQTGFDTWDFGEPIENGLINNGKLLLDGKNQDVDFLLNKLTSNSFMIELEFRISPEANQQGHCIIGAENNFGSAFHAAFYRDFADLAYYFSPGQGDKIASTSYAEMELNYDTEAFNNLTLIVLDHQIATFLNGQLLYTVPNPDGETFYSAQVLAAHTNGVCEYDNFRIWDLSKMDPAVKTALAAIHNEEPLYQTSFDTWDFGNRLNNAGIENGKLVVSSNSTNSGLVNINKFSSDRFAVEFELHNLETDSTSNCFYQAGNDQRAWSESWRALVPQFNNQAALLARFEYPDLNDFVGQSYTSSSVNTIRLLILGDQITAFVNGKSIYTTVNPDGSTDYYQHSLGAYGSREIDYVCEYDNYKYWDLSDVDFSAATNTTGTTSFFGSALASIAGKTPDYEDDFSNLESGWPTDRNSTGNEYGYQDGAYFISAKDICYGSGLPTDQVYSDFVLEMDVGFINQGDGTASIHFRNNGPAHYGVNISPGGWANFHKNVNGIHIDLLGTEVPASSFQAWDTPKHLRLIARQNLMALYVNGELVIALADTSSSQGTIFFAVCSSNPLQVLIDNLKIWDITEMSP